MSNAKPGDKDNRLNDGNGRYLLIKTNRETVAIKERVLCRTINELPQETLIIRKQ